MKERTAKIIKKSLAFEESGETFSVEVSLEDVSPNLKADTIISFLERLFENIKREITGQ